MWRSVFLRFKKEAVLLFLVSVFSILLLFSWHFLQYTFVVKQTLSILYNIASYLTAFFSSITSQPLSFDSAQGLLIKGTDSWSVFMPVKAYPIYLALLFGVFLLPPRKYFTVFVYALSTIAFLIFRASVITLFKIYLITSIHYALLQLISDTVYLPVYFWIVYIIKNNNLLLFYSIKINVVIERVSYFSVQQLALILILFNSLPMVLLQYSGNILSFITFNILHISEVLLNTVGYNAHVVANTIFIGKSWLSLEIACVGIGVWSIVLILILSLRGSWLKKAVYIPIFTLLFFLTNSIRLSWALKYAYENNLHQTSDFLHLHSIITYLMYAIAFLFLVIYIFWFESINFDKFLPGKKN